MPPRPIGSSAEDRDCTAAPRAASSHRHLRGLFLSNRPPEHRLRHAIRTMRGVLSGGDARTTALLRWRPPAGLFQPHGTTYEDRYPVMFRALADLLGDGPDRSILSFGCATGEEVVALRGHFPQAHIRGLDISAARIAVARRRLPPDMRGITDFVVAGSAAAEPRAHYHAVLAMAVFRHGDLTPRPPDCHAILPFARFDTAIATLAACIRPGGYLVLRNANFRFADTAAAAGFTAVLAAPNRNPLYGRDDRLLPETPMLDAIFRKHTV